MIYFFVVVAATTPSASPYEALETNYYEDSSTGTRQELQPKPSTSSKADHQVLNSSSSNSSSTSSSSSESSSESSDTSCSDVDTDDSVADKDYVPDKVNETDETGDESLLRNQSLCPDKLKAS